MPDYRPRCLHCPLADRPGACPGEAYAPELCGRTDPLSESYAPNAVAFVLTAAGYSAEAEAIPPAAGPGLLRKVANFAGAVVEHAAAGFTKAPPELAAARLAVCQTCPELIGGNSCRLCGCYMTLKATWLEKQCPLAKWPAPATT